MTISDEIPQASRIQVGGNVRDVNDYYHQEGWTDGLPIIPPTEDLVLEMIEACSLDSRESLGIMAPLNGTVTVEKIAVNAVMAGCKPDYFPVVIAAVKAVLQPQFNVAAITTTTGGAAPVIVVSGPIADRLGIHSGTAVFGSGHQANATIGRALRLTMRNMGGAKVSTMEKSTHGWPGKYTMCFAEATERSPWEPLHVELGYSEDTSIVTVAAVRGIQTLQEGAQETGEGVLETVVGAVHAMGISGFYYQQRGASPIVVFGPEHADEIANAGFSRKDVKQYLFENARVPKKMLRNRAHWAARQWPQEWEDHNDDFMIPIVDDPENLVIVVAGGDGRHSSWLLPWSATQRATEIIE